MDISGTQRIEAPREAVYGALNDLEILRQCIPGCQAIEKPDDGPLKLVMTLKIGPMTLSFAGQIALSDLDPPNGYTLTGEGSGGVAGFAKGTAVVRLEPAGDATLLHYTCKADIGGRLAQLGGRLIGGTARKLSGDFFAKLGALAAQSEAPVKVEVKKTGWFRRAIGTSSAFVLAGVLLAHAGSVAAQGPAAGDPLAYPLGHIGS